MNELNAMRKTETSDDDWLSALFDGELDEEAGKFAFSRLGKDSAAAHRWAEYSLIGDALRDSAEGRADFGARLHARLAAEPTILAPAPVKQDVQRPYYWMAAAAAVAAIAWSVLSVAPPDGGQIAAPVAANSDTMPESEVRAYLAAHQDYAYAVSDEPEMRLTRVSLSGENR